MMPGRTASRILTPLGLAVCLSLFGDLLDRWGRRRLFVFGMLLGVLSTASYGLMRGFWPFLAGRLAWGIAWTCINVGGMTMVLDMSTRSNRGRLTSIYNTWLHAGFALAPLVGGFLVDTIGFRSAMLACASLTAIGLTVAVLTLPETAQFANGNTEREPQPALSWRRRLRDSPRRIGRLLRDNRNLVTVSLLLLITLFAGEGVTLSTTSLLLQQRFGPNVVLGRLALGVSTAGGILLALRSLLAGAVGPLVGHLSDAYTGRWPVIVGSLAIGMVGFGLLAFAASPATIVLGVILGAVSGGAALATLAAQMGDLTPPGREGVVMGAYATVGDVGSMAGPFLAFAMLSVVDLRWVYLLCAFAFLIGLGLMIWRMRPHGLLALLVTCLLLAGCGTLTSGPPATPQPPASHKELARHYAPVIRQGVASDQDFITAVDFDGDWIGNNNWENQPTGDLSAYVYYSVIESETHWFLFYSLFHPRDYTHDPCKESDGCHENDMESIQVVIAKDGTSFGRPSDGRPSDGRPSDGRLQAMETLAHSHIYLYAADRSVAGNFLQVKGAVRLEGTHPVIYVETYGHGIYGQRKILLPHVVVYRVGEQAETPESLKDDDVSYQLVSIYDTLWTHRDEIGPGQAFDQPFDYQGHTLPAAIDGEDYGQDKANTPWGYDQEMGDTLSRGDFFLDPAKALAYHASFDGDFSLEYVHNPYLADLGLVEKQ